MYMPTHACSAPFIPKPYHAGGGGDDFGAGVGSVVLAVAFLPVVVADVVQVFLVELFGGDALRVEE